MATGRLTSQVLEVAIKSDAVRATSQVIEVGVTKTGDARLTSQVLEVAIKSDAVRATSQVIEVGVTKDGGARLTSQVLEVAIPFSLEVIKELATTITVSSVVVAGMSNPKQLVSSISASALVTANLTEETFLATEITSSVVVGADLSGLTRQLETSITGSILIAADLAIVFKQLEVDLTANINVEPIFDENLESATSTLNFTQNVISFVEHLGNTLDLTHSATVESTLTTEPSDLSSLTSIAEFVAVFDRSLIDTLGSLDHTAEFKHVLPVETASSTLSLSDNTTAARAGENTLALTSVAIGVIGGIEEDASNTLSFTSTAIRDTELLFAISDTLVLTQVVNADHTTSISASSSVNFNQLAFATNTTGKCLVILQAPFDFLQTSIVLSCPLFGDTENIVSEVSLRRSMNGATQTHVKTNANRRLTYTFRMLDRQKAVEVVEFFKYYNSDKIRLTNWKGEIWKVNLLTNPIDFVKTGRYRTDVSLEFEGIKLNG